MTMYIELIKDLQKEIEVFINEKIKIDKEINVRKDIVKNLRKLQAKIDRKEGNLAVQKGVCPFSSSCNKREYCTKDSCSADVCSNGYAYRMS